MTCFSQDLLRNSRNIPWSHFRDLRRRFGIDLNLWHCMLKNMNWALFSTHALHQLFLILFEKFGYFRHWAARALVDCPFLQWARSTARHPKPVFMLTIPAASTACLDIPQRLLSFHVSLAFPACFVTHDFSSHFPAKWLALWIDIDYDGWTIVLCPGRIQASEHRRITVKPKLLRYAEAWTLSAFSRLYCQPGRLQDQICILCSVNIHYFRVTKELRFPRMGCSSEKQKRAFISRG